MAATEKKQMHLVATADGVAPEVVIRQIAASQGIFMPGAPCYISQSGTVKLCDSSDGSDAWHGFIVGLANKSSTWPITAELAGNTEVEVLLIDPADTYAVYVENAGTDAAAPQALVGDQNGLTVSATSGQVGYTTLNTANANATVQVIDVMANRNGVKYDLTSTPGVALVKFLNSVVQATKA